MEHWNVADSELGIVITCRGHDKTRSAERAANTFRLLATKRAGRFAVIADLREMTGYESHSRRIWQEALRGERERLSRLVVIGARSRVIRMGAAVVGAFAGVPVRFVDGWDEVRGLDRAV